MSGPPPTPLHLRLLKGNPGKRAIRPEVEPTQAPTCPDPPPFVRGYAADEYWRVAPQLHTLGLLSALDLMPLCAYCTSYSRWLTAEECIARLAEADPVMHGLLVKGADGNPRRNPLVKIAADAAADMVAYAANFGMTPVARSRIAAGIFGQPPAPSRFGDLLA
jgi:P27 family predicted phage terminase small subunit